jgi:hypothetical protein
MTIHETPALGGQALVYDCWSARLHGRRFIAREDLHFERLAAELAHMSVLALEPGGFRFRLAGTALRRAFGREPRGLAPDQLVNCTGMGAWCGALHKTLERLVPVSGQTPTEDGGLHFWLRLPMSSDGVKPDLVLCHDRVLTAEQLADPERACREANMALRLDLFEEPKAA